MEILLLTTTATFSATTATTADTYFLQAYGIFKTGSNMLTKIKIEWSENAYGLLVLT